MREREIYIYEKIGLNMMKARKLGKHDEVW
jgi:hypothetical protein